MSDAPIHPSQSFGSAAELYDRARPSYPQRAIDSLLETGGRQVLDVGCGTGILARSFLARGCDVLGIEPDDRMANVARRHGVTVETSRFEDWEPAGRSFDLVVSGMAWHWVDREIASAKAGEVLRVGGAFAALWSFFDLPDEVRAALLPAYERHAPGLPSTAAVLVGAPPSGAADADADALSDSGRFGPPWREEYRYTTQSWVDELATRSSHRTLPADVRAALLADVAAAIDGVGGSFEVTYSTRVLRAVSRSSGAR